jgi:hypothetical protein
MSWGGWIDELRRGKDERKTIGNQPDGIFRQIDLKR